jgi:hypothetical protein
VERTRQELAALDAPPADREVWARKSVLFGKSFLVFEKMLRSAEERDTRAVKRAQRRLKEINRELDRWASKYGFSACSRGS